MGHNGRLEDQKRTHDIEQISPSLRCFVFVEMIDDGDGEFHFTIAIVAVMISFLGDAIKTVAVMIT